MPTALQGWHPGEAALQRELGFADAVSEKWKNIENELREQHRIFHTSNLPFIPVTTIDDCGRPWGSIVAGATGEIGFVKSPDAQTLTVDARFWDGEPLLSTIRTWLCPQEREVAAPERFLTAGIGIEFSTRRRNKFAGFITDVKLLRTDRDFELAFRVTQALGNCPKYINKRNLIPYHDTHPSVAYQDLHMGTSERLPDDIIKFIINADTVFIATVYKSDSCTEGKYPSHAGMNARGGLPGFVRVRPSDGRTVVLPDYSGNRLLSSLGNIKSTNLAGLTIVSFTTGDVLYLTGAAEVLIGRSALDIMARQASITTILTTGYTFVRDALTVRQDPGVKVERSPYSPKIKYLLEESEAQAAGFDGHQVQLKGAMQFSHDIAILRFEIISKPGLGNLRIRPGQAIALDFMDWIGPPAYQHMANDAPSSINDDRVRTWTVSSAHEDKDVTWFEITMRKMNGGTVTGALFDVLGAQPNINSEHLMQITADNVTAGIVGVTGDFYMGKKEVRMLLVAGGIGITPFISMLRALIERKYSSQDDVIITLATKEPDIFLKLLSRSVQGVGRNVKIRIDLFTNEDSFSNWGLEKIGVEITIFKGRIRKEYWENVAFNRDVFICGPVGFGDAAVDGLRAAGVLNGRISREGFY